MGQRKKSFFYIPPWNWTYSRFDWIPINHKTLEVSSGCLVSIISSFTLNQWILSSFFRGPVRGSDEFKFEVETCIIHTYGGFLKWWYPKTIAFPTKNDHFEVFWGYHNFRKHPYIDSEKVYDWTPKTYRSKTEPQGIFGRLLGCPWKWSQLVSWFIFITYLGDLSNLLM